MIKIVSLRSITERLLLGIVADSDDATVAWALDGTVLIWNAAAEQVFGYSATEALGQPVTRFFGAELLRALETPEPTHGAHTHLAELMGRDGVGVTVPLEVRRVLDAQGEPIGGVARVRNRGSGGAHARGAPSQEDAERLSLALAAARLGDWGWDARTDVVVLSARAAEIFGVNANTHTTWEALRELLHPDDREAARLAVERALTSHGDYSIEYRLINAGRERWVAASGRGRYAASGEAMGMFGMVQDISSDRLLLRLDDAVRPLVRSEDITYTAARVLGEHLNVHRCAYAFVEADEDTFILTGNYTNGVQSIVGRYRFRQFGAECLRLMRRGEAYVVNDSNADPRIDEQDRKAYAFTAIRAVICVPILKSGRFVAAMAVHMQVCRSWSAAEVALVQQVASRCWESIERARFEAEREILLERAEAANRAKDEFLAMLGHELRNPLAPIVTALQIMKLRDASSSRRERTVIERQVNHLTRLVDDLLDVSRIARAKIVLKKELVELSDVVLHAVEVASPLFEQRAHTLALELTRNGLLVEGDLARLTQVVSNLLTNAGKYTPPGGHIVVATRLEGEEAVLRVRDNGIGMSAEVLPHVFELFAQGGQAIDRAQGGLGLGLSIVRDLVERHGGSVAALSDGQDRGSELVVRLPRAHPGDAKLTPASQQRASEQQTSALGARVLVVDDNEDAAEMLAEALRLRGCVVHIAHHGPGALELGAAQSFDAALLDLGLPMMDGYELAARLRELPNLEKAQFIAVTGYGQDSDRQRSSAAGFHHHLVKPVNLSALETLVGSLAGAATPRHGGARDPLPADG
ncbi:MAG TPA: ATP-binding protein [Polyangiaceae bacterium]|nr:ATP-binding protein [Polyangiaceae bacterium]